MEVMERRVDGRPAAYVAPAAVGSASHAATAHLSFQLTMTFPVRNTSQSPVLVSHITPQYVVAHGVFSNALCRLTSSSTHQPRSWLKAEVS